MARSDAVWGIDIGQCSLKALRCRPGGQPGQIVAEAFDYIAYPKILSQPGAEPAELIREALGQFLSRNSVRGDRVAISVPGQNGLARFIKLPPVEAKKIPNIVRYEARQQIPFDLADVVWDYQRMGGGAEEEGFVLETEIGLFAMKRDQVNRALEPFTAAGIEVDVVQLTPLALYNFLLFDQLHDRPSADQYDPDSPPPSTVILSLGTDATDLVVTNGFRVWQRSIPLGGNHFTRALTKELKLTFAKAEHLKCNAASAQDPKALFQAMRPVFNDLLTEIQRSISYFQNIDRRATIEKVVALGNAMKMPGLRRYLSQSLAMEVVRADSFRGLVGPEVLAAPAFKDNVLCFGVCYGLAVQALGVGRGTLSTNLLPPEILKDRFIRGKKPWAVAAAALLLLGCTIGYAGLSMALGTVDEKLFEPAEKQIAEVVRTSGELKSEHDKIAAEIEETKKIGEHLVSNVDSRVLWLELLRAVNECLPGDPPDKRPKDYADRKELHIVSLQCERMPDLQGWFTLPQVQSELKNSLGQSATATPGTDAATPPPAATPGAVANATPAPAPTPAAPAATGSAPTDPAMAGATAGEPPADPGPQGEGWVITLRGYTYYIKGGAAEFVRNTLIKNLREHQIVLPAADKDAIVDGQKKTEELVSMADLGISHPVLFDLGKMWKDTFVDLGAAQDAVPSGTATPAGGPGAGVTGPGIEPGMGGAPGVAVGGGPGMGMAGATGTTRGKQITLDRYDFVVQFVWKPTPPAARLKKKLDAQQGVSTTDAANPAAKPPQGG